MKNLFAHKPTERIILKTLHCLGFTDLQDTRQVAEEHLLPHLLEEVKEEVRVFYYPVFYKEYVLREDFNYKHLITVARQLLRTIGRQLIRKEKCKRVDANIYRYYSVYELSVPDTHTGVVTFNDVNTV